MTSVVQSSPADSQSEISAIETPAADAGAQEWRESWEAVRDDPDIQFEEVVFDLQPPEPSWLTEMLQAIGDFLAMIFGPVGGAVGTAWPVLQWVLLGIAIVFALYLIARTFGPLARKSNEAKAPAQDPGWAPSESDSMALLEEADRLAAEGRFDEATHLLLRRSVGQIAEARPDWVDPSSTSRELAALPALSDAARSAFEVISDRVERSLFALRSLDRSDWEAARSAYAKFALAKLEAGTGREVAT